MPLVHVPRYTYQVHVPGPQWIGCFGRMQPAINHLWNDRLLLLYLDYITKSQILSNPQLIDQIHSAIISFLVVQLGSLCICRLLPIHLQEYEGPHPIVHLVFYMFAKNV